MYYVYTDIDVYTNACLYYFSGSFECKLQTLCFYFCQCSLFFPPKQGHCLISAMLIQYYFRIHSPYSIIPTSFICFFFSRLESHPRLCIVLNCPVSLTSFNLEESLFHELDISEKNKSVIYRTPIWVCLMLPHAWSCIWGIMCEVVFCPFLGHIKWHMNSITLLAMSTLISWLGWCLPGFYTVKSPFFSIIDFWWGKVRLYKYLVIHQTSTHSFWHLLMILI